MLSIVPPVTLYILVLRRLSHGLPVPREAVEKFRVRSLGRPVARHDDNVMAVQPRLRDTEALPDDSFQTIARHRMAHSLFCYRQSKARPSRSVRPVKHRETIVHGASIILEDSIEFRRIGKSRDALKCTSRADRFTDPIACRPPGNSNGIIRRDPLHGGA